MVVTNSGAIFSDCGKYRYRLWRIWGSGRRVVWIMLNPSTADADTNDPTIRKCLGFTRQWEQDGIEVINLFGVRATNPKDILKLSNPVGPDNTATVRNLLDLAKAQGWIVVAAWGALRARHRSYAEQMLRWFAMHRIEPMCLDVTKHGHPRHPLYVPYLQYPMPLELACERRKVANAST